MWKMMRPETDTELWQRARDDDRAAFGELYERHARPVQAYCLRRTADRQVAEDVTSMVFLEAWRERGKRELTTPDARPLLLGIATNLLHRHWRTRRRYEAALERMRPADAAAPRHEDDTIDRLDAMRQLRDARYAIGHLPRRELDVLTLVAWAELSYEETAVALGVPVGTVRSRLSRARARFGDAPSAQLADLVPTPGPSR